MRGVAQLVARHVRDVEVGSSSLLTPTQHSDSRVNNNSAVVVYIIELLRFSMINDDF